MRILSLDASVTQSGWAVYDVPGSEKLIKCGSFSCADFSDPEEQTERFARCVKKLIGIYSPDFFSWEQASRRISMYGKVRNAGLVPDDAVVMTPNAKALVLSKLEGVLIGAAIFYRLAHESVPVSTWRAALYGKGYGNLTTAEANAKAIEYCRWLGIKADNDDEREACLVARWTATCSQRFKLLQHKQEKAA